MFYEARVSVINLLMQKQISRKS